MKCQLKINQDYISSSKLMLRLVYCKCILCYIGILGQAKHHQVLSKDLLTRHKYVHFHDTGIEPESIPTYRALNIVLT